jgi:hypothetical protein
MAIPDPVNAVNGMNQGSAGFGQGAIGSQVGQSQGPDIGINRAATGGPNMDQTAQAPTPNTTGATAPNSVRTTQSAGSFFSSLGGLASAIGTVVPGASILGGLFSAIGGSQAQQAASAASAASTANQNAIAGQLATGPSLAPLIKQEQAGITSAVNNSNAANPGKLLMDLFGQSISNAIGGVASQRNTGLNDAANIYKNTGDAATTAATSQGNPFGGLGTALSGLTGAGAGGSTTGTFGLNVPTPSPLGGVATGAGSATSAPMAPPTPANPFAGFGGGAGGPSAGLPTTSTVSTSQAY